MGRLDSLQNPSPEDSTLIYEAIDLRLKSLHEIGTLWWKVQQATDDQTVNAGDSVVAVPTDLLFPIAVTLLDGSTTYPLEQINVRQYNRIQNKTDEGRPEQIYLNYEGVRTGVLYPVSSATYTVKIVYQRMIDDAAEDTNIDVPSWALRPLIDVLRYDVADDFQIKDENRLTRWRIDYNAGLRALRTMNHQRKDYQTVEAEYF